MSEPWECPRCGRMNAPFNLTCFCKPNHKDNLNHHFIEKELSRIEDVCTECGGFYGILNGKPKSCHCLKNYK